MGDARDVGEPSEKCDASDGDLPERESRVPSKGSRPASASALDAPLRSDCLADAIECPFCGGLETEQFAAFGSALSVSQYYCRKCRTVFETFKRHPPSS